MRISDWSSDVCSSDLEGEAAERGAAIIDRVAALDLLCPPARDAGFQRVAPPQPGARHGERHQQQQEGGSDSQAGRAHGRHDSCGQAAVQPESARPCNRSDEHTSELQSLMRISYAVICLKKKKKKRKHI